MAWNRNENEASVKPPTKTAAPPSFKKGLLAGLIVVVGAGLAAFIIGRGARPARPQEAKKAATRQIAEVKPQIVTQAVEVAEKKVEEKPKEPFVKAPGKMLTPDGRVLTFPPPKPGEFRVIHSRGQMFRCDSEGNFEDVTPKPVFDNAFEENLVGMAMENGAFIPGMLMGHSNEEILNMLMKKVVINEDDPPEVIEKKEAVAALKEDVISYIKEGGTFDEYVMEMRKQTVKEKYLKSMATKEIVTMLKEGRASEASAFCDAFNEKYGKEGMRPLRLPSHITQILEENREVK